MFGPGYIGFTQINQGAGSYQPLGPLGSSVWVPNNSQAQAAPNPNAGLGPTKFKDENPTHIYAGGGAGTRPMAPLGVPHTPVNRAGVRMANLDNLSTALRSGGGESNG